MLQEIKVPVFDRSKFENRSLRDGAASRHFYAVEAEVTESLAVHPTVKGQTPEETGLSDDFWTLTHVPSGGSIASNLPSKEAAEWLREQIKGLADWATFTPQSKNYNRVHRAIRPFIVDAVYERFN